MPHVERKLFLHFTENVKARPHSFLVSSCLILDSMWLGSFSPTLTRWCLRVPQLFCEPSLRYHAYQRLLPGDLSGFANLCSSAASQCPFKLCACQVHFVGNCILHCFFLGREQVSDLPGRRLCMQYLSCFPGPFTFLSTLAT